MAGKRGKSFWVESIGIVPKPRIAMQREHRNVNARAGRDLTRDDEGSRLFSTSRRRVDEHANAASWRLCGDLPFS